MTKWRPKEWAKMNPFSRENDPLHMNSQEPNYTDFEAGADAMIGALKKQGIDHKVYADHLRFGFDRGAKVLEGKEEAITYQGVKGTLVFIPDDD